MVHKSEHQRVVEAYKEMARLAKYRPAAPGDGMGSVCLSRAELRDSSRLNREAQEYAANYISEENSHSFAIGLSNYQTNRALVYVIEAARNLCGGGDDVALRLLKMAMEEIKKETCDS